MSYNLEQRLHDLSIGTGSKTPLAAIARIAELEAKLTVVEKERDDLRSIAEAETREGEKAFRNNAMNQIDRTWDIDRIKDAMGVIHTEGAIAKIKGEQT